MNNIEIEKLLWKIISFTAIVNLKEVGVGGFKVNVADNFDELVRDHVVYQMMMSGTKEEYPIILEEVH